MDFTLPKVKKKKKSFKIRVDLVGLQSSLSPGEMETFFSYSLWKLANNTARVIAWVPQESETYYKDFSYSFIREKDPM